MPAGKLKVDRRAHTPILLVYFLCGCRATHWSAGCLAPSQWLKVLQITNLINKTKQLAGRLSCLWPWSVCLLKLLLTVYTLSPWGSGGSIVNKSARTSALVTQIGSFQTRKTFLASKYVKNVPLSAQDKKKKTFKMRTRPSFLNWFLVQTVKQGSN